MVNKVMEDATQLKKPENDFWVILLALVPILTITLGCSIAEFDAGAEQRQHLIETQNRAHNLIDQASFVVPKNTPTPALIVKASTDCPFKAGTPHMLSGPIKTEGLAGDANHIRIRWQDLDHPSCEAVAITPIDVLTQEAEREERAIDQNQATNSELANMMKTLPASTMQDALSAANGR